MQLSLGLSARQLPASQSAWHNEEGTGIHVGERANDLPNAQLLIPSSTAHAYRQRSKSIGGSEE